MSTSQPYKAFIVEDNEWYNKLLVHCLSQNPDIEVKNFFNGGDFLKALHENPQVVTLDYKLPDTDGAELLGKIDEYNLANKTEIKAIIISDQSDIEIAVGLLKHESAFDYLVKSPDMHSRIFNIVNNVLKQSSLQERVDYLQKEVEQKYNFSTTIIGQSQAIKNIFTLLSKASASNINVSITGETGTGKELVAKAIHYNSDRKNKPFVAVNMSAIPKELIESELFGHEKGAFTGAIEKRKGKFMEAHGGTIFLDEIAEMDLSMQTKLLRVLQEREVTPVGSNTATKIDCKLIVATHQNLKKLVEEKQFREDLFFRIMGLNIHLPPLRDRDHDVLLIAKHHIDEFCKSNQMPPKSLSEKACQKLLSYPFPGNVRELKAVIEVAVVLSDTNEIMDDHIMFQHTNFTNQLLTEELTIREYTYRIIAAMLRKYNDDIPKIAKILDISPATIYRILKEFQHQL